LKWYFIFQPGLQHLISRRDERLQPAVIGEIHPQLSDFPEFSSFGDLAAALPNLNSITCSARIPPAQKSISIIRGKSRGEFTWTIR
jgi:hypothetical protein